MTRLPTPGGDAGNWGSILNEYLSAVHNTDGSLKTGVVAGSNLVDGSITTDKLADAAITPAKLASSVQTTLSSVVTTSTVGAAGGIASLDSSGKVPASQLPEASGGTTPAATASVSGTIRLTGDLGGSATSPSVVKLNGVSLTGTPSAGQALVATSSTAAGWQAVSGSTNPNAGTVWNTTSDPASGSSASSVGEGDLWVDESSATEVILYTRANGNWAEITRASKPAGPPPSNEPSSVSTSGITSNSITLNWQAPANPAGTVQGYNVYRATTKLNQSLIPVGTTTYAVTSLTPDTNYTFTIKSVISQTGGTQEESTGVNVQAKTGSTATGEETDAPLTGRTRLWSNKSSWIFRSHSSDPIDPNSTQIAGHLSQALVKGSYGKVLGCNFGNYSVNFYYADANTPRQDIRVTEQWASSKIGGRHGYTKLPDGTYIIPNVPVPAGAKGADGTDGAAVIFDPLNNRIIECWILRQDEIRGGSYLKTAQGGHEDSVSTWDGRWTPTLGVSASAISMGQTCLSVDDFMVGQQKGYFGRAIYFGIAPEWVNTQFRYPAGRTDGSPDMPNPYLSEGMRFILPPDFDVNQYPTLTPFAKMVAENMRRGHPLTLCDRTQWGTGGGATSLEGASGLVTQLPSLFPNEAAVRDYYYQWFGGRDEWTQFTDFPFDKALVINASVSN